jgi:hypothetical protein
VKSIYISEIKYGICQETASRHSRAGSRTRISPKASSYSAFQLPAVLVLGLIRTKDAHPGSPAKKPVAACRR